jgi:hypothetical protein
VDDSTFLSLYQPLAESSRYDSDYPCSFLPHLMFYNRRLFYLLSSISCVGAWDVFLSLLRSRKRAGSLGSLSDNSRIFSSIIAISVAILQSVGFLTSIIAAKYDTLITDRFGDMSSSWISNALDDTKNREYISAWRTLSSVRLVVCLLAWFG